MSLSRSPAIAPLTAVVFDDLQWADPATLDLITYAARSPREARVTLILAARVDETAPDSPIRRGLRRRAAADRWRESPPLGTLAMTKRADCSTTW